MAPTSFQGPVGFRVARVEDAAGIGALHVAAWRATYRGLFPGDLLDGLRSEDFAERHRQRILAPSPEDARLWVAEGRGGLLGFSVGGSARDGDLPPHVGEVYAIYLLPGLIGQGIGRGLFGRSLDSLRELGKREVVVWLADANARARRFYAAAGLRLDPTAAPKPVVLQGRDLGVLEVRMRGPVPGASA